MYLIKLTSKIEEDQIPLIAEKVASFLNTDPAKIEKVLAKEQGNIGKAHTIEKAEEVAAVFRDAGVKVALVEDQVPTRKQISQVQTRGGINERASPKANTNVAPTTNRSGSQIQTKQKFRLSKSNGIYFGVVALLYFVLSVAFTDKIPYQIEFLTGKLVGLLIFSLLFAWIIWRLSGRKGKGGNLTFNIVLTLALLGQIGQIGNKLQQSPRLGELQEQKEEFKKEFFNTDDPAEIDTAYNEFADSVEDELSRLSEISTGSEKQLYRIMSDFFTQSQTITQNWSESYNTVLSPRILDFSLLSSDEEFDYQRNILRIYVEKTKLYDEFFASSVPNLRKRLSILGEESEHVQAVVKGTTEKYLSQKPIFEPLMQAHVEYGENMIQLLELLQKNKDEWAYESNELLIYSESVLNDYNELIEELGNNEAMINTLSRKLIEEI